MFRLSGLKKASKLFLVSVLVSVLGLFLSVIPASADVTITDGQSATITGNPHSRLQSTSFLNAAVTLNQLTQSNSANLFNCGNLYEIRDSNVVNLNQTLGNTTVGGKIQQDLNTNSSRVSNFTYNANANYRVWCVGPTVNPYYFAGLGTVEITISGNAYSVFIVGPNSFLIPSNASFSSSSSSTPLPVFVATKRVQIKQTADEYTCIAGSYKYGTSSSLTDVSLIGATYKLKSEGSVIDTKTSDSGSYSWKKKDVSVSGLVTCEITFKSIGEIDKSDWDSKAYADASNIQRNGNAVALIKKGKAVSAASIKNSADKKTAYAKSEKARVKIMEERAAELSKIASSFSGGKIGQDEFNSSYSATKKSYAAKLAANMESLRNTIAEINAAKQSAFDAAEAAFLAEKDSARKALSAALEAVGYGFYSN